MKRTKHITECKKNLKTYNGNKSERHQSETLPLHKNRVQLVTEWWCLLTCQSWSIKVWYYFGLKIN